MSTPQPRRQLIAQGQCPIPSRLKKFSFILLFRSHFHFGEIHGMGGPPAPSPPPAPPQCAALVLLGGVCAFGVNLTCYLAQWGTGGNPLSEIGRSASNLSSPSLRGLRRWGQSEPSSLLRRVCGWGGCRNPLRWCFGGGRGILVVQDPASFERVRGMPPSISHPPMKQRRPPTFTEDGGQPSAPLTSSSAAPAPSPTASPVCAADPPP